MCLAKGKWLKDLPHHTSGKSGWNSSLLASAWPRFGSCVHLKREMEDINVQVLVLGSSPGPLSYSVALSNKCIFKKNFKIKQINWEFWITSSTQVVHYMLSFLGKETNRHLTSVLVITRCLGWNPPIASDSGFLLTYLVMAHHSRWWHQMSGFSLMHLGGTKRWFCHPSGRPGWSS